MLVKIRQEQTLLPNEEVSSQSCDMDEGGLASMPELCTKKIIRDKEKKKKRIEYIFPNTSFLSHLSRLTF